MPSITFRPAAIAVSALLLLQPTHAQVYKCVASDGKISISNLGCASGSTAARVDSRPNSMDQSGSRQQAARNWTKRRTKCWRREPRQRRFRVPQRP